MDHCTRLNIFFYINSLWNPIQRAVNQSSFRVENMFVWSSYIRLCSHSWDPIPTTLSTPYKQGALRSQGQKPLFLLHHISRGTFFNADWLPLLLEHVMMPSLPTTRNKAFVLLYKIMESLLILQNYDILFFNG